MTAFVPFPFFFLVAPVVLVTQTLSIVHIYSIIISHDVPIILHVPRQQCSTTRSPFHVGKPLTAKSPTTHLFSCHQYMLLRFLSEDDVEGPPLAGS